MSINIVGVKMAQKEPVDFSMTTEPTVRLPRVRRSRCIFFILLGISILLYGNGMMFLGLLGTPAQAEAMVSGPVLQLSHPGNGLFALHVIQYEFATDDDESVQGRSVRLLRPDSMTGGMVPVRYLRFLPLINWPEHGLMSFGLSLAVAGLMLTGVGAVFAHRLREARRRLHVTILDGMLMLKPNTRR